jgi:hypothetical protein
MRIDFIVKRVVCLCGGEQQRESRLCQQSTDVDTTAFGMVCVFPTPRHSLSLYDAPRLCLCVCITLSMVAGFQCTHPMHPQRARGWGVTCTRALSSTQEAGVHAHAPSSERKESFLFRYFVYIVAAQVRARKMGVSRKGCSSRFVQLSAFLRLFSWHGYNIYSTCAIAWDGITGRVRDRESKHTHIYIYTSGQWADEQPFSVARTDRDRPGDTHTHTHPHWVESSNRLGLAVCHDRPRSTLQTPCGALPLCCVYA